MRGRLKIFIISIVVLCSFVIASKVNAESNSVIINEVMWAGSTKSSHDEWIELKNIGREPVNIAGWEIKNASRGETSLFIPTDKEYIINPDDYFLVSYYQKGEVNTTLDTESDFVTHQLSLANSNNGDLVLLNDKKEEIDKNIGDSWPAGNNTEKLSMERIDQNTSGMDKNNWQSAYTAVNLINGISDKATPKVSNSHFDFKPVSDFNAQLVNYINIDNFVETDAIVTDVIDGDTIEVNFALGTQKVRLIGIDSPESAYSSDFELDEPYYLAAKEYLEENLQGKTIKLIIPYSINDRYDNYHRLLAVAADTENIYNISMLENGFARTFYLNDFYEKIDFWITIENKAKNDYLGVWQDFNNTCIEINELMINPAGPDEENEWIELYNKCDREMNIKNWILDDGQHGSKPYLINHDLIINARDYIVISASESAIILNNSADRARLFTPDLNIGYEVEYKEAKENWSYAKLDDNSWIWTPNFTKGAKNIIAIDNENNRDDYQIVANLNDLTQIPKDTKVKIDGVVNSEPNQIAKQYFYIEDETCGVQIYSYYGNFPDLKIGDRISVMGQLSDTNYLRVKVDSVSSITKIEQSVNFSVKKLDIKDINASYSGLLIMIEGRVSRLSGSIFYLSQNGSEVKIDVKEQTGFKRPNLEKNDFVRIQGILYQSSQGNLSILPRIIDDIQIINKYYNDNNLKIITEFNTLCELNDEIVKVKGIVNSLPGMLNARYFYIENNKMGLQIYSYNKDFPYLALGDEVEIIGTVSQNGLRLKINQAEDIKIISHYNSLTSFNIAGMQPANFLGILVFLTGIVEEKSGRSMILNCRGMKYKIYLKSNNSFKSSGIKIGDELYVVGIIEKINNEFRIIPRDTNDLVNLTKNLHQKSLVLSPQKNVVKNDILINNLPKSSKYLSKPDKSLYNDTIQNILKSLAIVCVLMVVILL